LLTLNTNEKRLNRKISVTQVRFSYLKQPHLLNYFLGDFRGEVALDLVPGLGPSLSFGDFGDLSFGDRVVGDFGVGVFFTGEV
jgi:hypothetical protein